jgi:hypothetical protein
MIGVLAEDQPQMPLACDQHPVQTFAAGDGNPALPRSGSARGARTGVLMIRMPAAAHTALNAEANWAPRSRIRNLQTSARSSGFMSRLQACGVTHPALGRAVIAVRCTRRAAVLDEEQAVGDG